LYGARIGPRTAAPNADVPPALLAGTTGEFADEILRLVRRQENP
jgi:hypothetical protein